MSDSPSLLRRGLALLGLCAPPPANLLEEGMPAPDFELPDAEGELRRLGDYAGKWLVLYFYPKDDTPHCTAEACAFRDDYGAAAGLDADVVGISADSPKSHRAFAARHKLPFPLLADRGAVVARRYGAGARLFGLAYAKRQTFLIDPGGVIRCVWREVPAAGHARDVLGALEAMRRRE